jgi:hypothetical protein
MKQALVCACVAVALGCSYGPIELIEPRDTDAGDGDGGRQPVAGNGGSDPGRQSDAGGTGGTAGGAGSVADDAGRDGGDAGDAGDGSDDPDPPRDPDPLRVVALSDAATQWNDYALQEDLETACPEASPAPEQGCVHAGALRKVELPDEESCDGLEIEDERGWFDWTCSDDADAVVFSTTRLRDGITLRDLIDTDEPAWRTNTVTVTRGSDVVAESESEQLWTNPVSFVPSSPTGVLELDERGAVYVLDDTPAADLRIVEDAVSLLAQSGVELRTAASAEPLLAIDAGRPVYFAWIEGIAVDADDHADGVDLRELVHAVVRDLSVTRDMTFGGGAGTDLRIDAAASMLEGLASTRSAGEGIELDGEGNAVHDVAVTDPAGDGLELRLQDSTLAGLRVQSAGGSGVRLRGATGNTLEQVSVANCDGNGIDFESDTRNDLLVDAVVSSNGASGIVVRGADHRVLLSVSASNEDDGIRVDGVNMLLQHVTTANNAEMGLRVTPAARYVQIVNALSTNNQGGLWINDNSARTSVHDVWFASNGGGVAVDGDENVFSGELALSGSNTCVVQGPAVPMVVEPGLAEPCANADDSSAVLSFDNALQSMIVPIDDGVLAGQQLDSDPMNAQVAADGAIGHPDIADWLTFSNRFRHWGKHVTSGFFPNAAGTGRCSEATDCAFWDWRVSQLESRVRDALEYDEAPLLSVLEVAVHARTQPWSPQNGPACDAIRGARWDDGASECATPFLAYAFEPRDGLGDDDFLCAPGEVCILNRNRGAYTGHGTQTPLDPGDVDEQVDVPGFGSVRLSMFTLNGE